MKGLYKTLIGKIGNKQTVLIILIIGIVLMLAAESFTDEKAEERKSVEYINSDSYCRYLEDKLTTILSEMKDVGRVYVMITLEDRNAVDISVKEQSGEAVLKRTGSNEEPVVTKELYPAVKGVVIAAQGAASQEVAEKIYYAAKAALDIGGSKIAVVEAK